MMLGRPEISKELGSKRFREFYYTVAELVEFCKANGLEYSDDKEELIDRICMFMDGKRYVPKFIDKPVYEPVETALTEDTLIGENFVFTDKHFEFFRRIIGSYFILNDDFEEWLLAHEGSTLGDAVDAWYLLEEG